jgi:hypothetical protein
VLEEAVDQLGGIAASRTYHADLHSSGHDGVR